MPQEATTTETAEQQEARRARNRLEAGLGNVAENLTAVGATPEQQKSILIGSPQEAQRRAQEFAAGTLQISEPTAVEDKLSAAYAPLLETQRALESDAASQIKAGYENIARQQELARQTAIANVEQPITAALAERVGVRGGFEAGTAAGIRAEIPRTMELAISGDPRVIDAQNKIMRASAALAQARQNVQTIEQAQKVMDIQQDLAAAQKTIKDVTAEKTAAKKTAVDQLEFLTKLPASTWETLPAATISGIFERAGYSPTLGLALKQAQADVALAEKGKDEIATAQSRANLAKTLKEISAPTTDFERKRDMLGEMLQAGIIDQTKYSQGLEQLVGLEGEETPKDRATRLKTEAETRGENIKNAKLTKGGATNGVKQLDPTGILTNFDFGAGSKGEQIKDEKGNVIAKISSPYGADHSQESGEKFHNALDVVFNNGEVRALSGGTIVKKGTDTAYGSFVWLQNPETGYTVQYAHLEPGSVAALNTGEYLNPNDVFAKHSTNPREWGISTGAHTDVRVVGMASSESDVDNVDPVVRDWGYQVLDGFAKPANIADKDTRDAVVQFVQKKREEGYRSKYPVLTETQLELVNQISDDFNNNKQVGDMLDVKSGFESVKTIYGSDPKIANATGFDDITAINAFQRMIDPGATVREGDISLLQTSIPFLERVSPFFRWSKFQKGDKLPADVRESLFRVARDVYNEKAGTFNNTVGNRFTERAEAAGIPANLAIDTFPVYTERDPTPEEKVQQVSNQELSTINQQLEEIEIQLSGNTNQTERGKK